MRRSEARVLLVEDNPSDEMLTVRALKSTPIRCVIEVARDGAEALEWLKDPTSVSPDLVLLDLKLPKVGGHEVLIELRRSARTKRVPVICLTSSDEPSDVDDCFESGANSFVRKPTDFAEYMTMVGKTVDYWLNVNVPCSP